MSRIEESVYFRIARGFAWFILIVAIVGFAGTTFYATSSLKQLIGGEKSVTAQDVRESISAKKAGVRGNAATPQNEPEFDPKAMGLLTTEVGEIFKLLDSAQKEAAGGWDKFSRDMSRAFRSASVEEQIEALREVRSVVGQIDQPDRMAAIMEYMDLTQQHKREAEVRKIEAVKNVTLLGSAVATTAALITLVSMVLVLLAIERNTRRS